MIPYEPLIPFTIGSLIVWYMILLLGASLGVLGAGFICNKITSIKLIIGALLGMGWVYIMSWLFGSKTSMEFGQVFNTIIKTAQ